MDLHGHFEIYYYDLNIVIKQKNILHVLLINYLTISFRHQ